MRRRHDGAFKAKVALEAIKGEKTLSEVGSQYGVHPLQVAKWKKQALEELPLALADKRGSRKNEDPSVDDLYRQIGKLQVEVEWLKKKSRQLS